MTEQSGSSPCTARHLNHVAIAVNDIEDTIRFYQETFGAGQAEVENLEDQAVLAALVRVGGSSIEFIQPTDPQGGVARFIERRGEGLHHLAFNVSDLAGKLAALEGLGIRLVDREPREGLSGDIAFIHPRSVFGILTELVENRE